MNYLKDRANSALQATLYCKEQTLKVSSQKRIQKLRNVCLNVEKSQNLKNDKNKIQKTKKCHYSTILHLHVPFPYL